jgi:hypothetical protein
MYSASRAVSAAATLQKAKRVTTGDPRANQGRINTDAAASCRSSSSAEELEAVEVTAAMLPRAATRAARS